MCLAVVVLCLSVMSISMDLVRSFIIYVLISLMYWLVQSIKHYPVPYFAVDWWASLSGNLLPNTIVSGFEIIWNRNHCSGFLPPHLGVPRVRSQHACLCVLRNHHRGRCGGKFWRPWAGHPEKFWPRLDGPQLVSAQCHPLCNHCDNHAIHEAIRRRVHLDRCDIVDMGRTSWCSGLVACPYRRSWGISIGLKCQQTVCFSLLNSIDTLGQCLKLRRRVRYITSKIVYLHALIILFQT